MIILFDTINKIDNELLDMKNDHILYDYRVVLNINNSISIYIITNKDDDRINDFCLKYKDTYVNILSKMEYTKDKETLNYIFDSSNRVNISSTRRHLSNLLNPVKHIKSNVPVLTFYSYKGGVGRSTTLAACASFLAIHHKKKIVILDCDFEAPGFNNFYLEDPNHPHYKNGLVEYFVDSKANNLSLTNYYWEASKRYSGDGEIYIFPAGNLDENYKLGGELDTNLKHYINGLTRIDMFSPDVLVEQFNKLLINIKDEINPDVIFIDSRTGFNDIFGISAYRLSDLVVGFFGNSVQTRPGLDFFLDTMQQKDAPELLLVNSIMPATSKKTNFEDFKEYVNNYLLKLSEKMSNGVCDFQQLSIDMFYLSFNDVLNIVGNPNEDYDDFIEMISNKAFVDFNNLFDYINEKIDTLLNESNVFSDNEKTLKDESFEERIDEKILLDEKSSKKQVEQEEQSSLEFKIKQKILASLREKMPKLYAEDITDFEEEYSSNRYFYRNCMEDLFNSNKILVLGNKGTGKSYIYRSLKNNNIVTQLKIRANKENLNCQFLHIVDNCKRIDTAKFDDIDMHKEDSYFERFWIVYIWNAIMLDKPFGYETKLDIKDIKDDFNSSFIFKKIINDDEKIVEIENDLYSLDRYLKEKENSQIIIIFDELDSIVRPHKWSERISPLINLCRRMSYSSIFPKLFLRSDLYEKITNLNNKNELNNRSISIEWNREELFAYFFKLILSESKDDFFKLMRLYKYYPDFYINKVMKKMNDLDDQPPLDDYILRQFCATFFGRYADVNNSPRFGESYEWFFRNLKNANETISLRPFLDLISDALDHALSEDKSDKPILPQYYYTFGPSRAKAVENHFKDLASEKGNEDLNPIFKFIRDKANFRYKKEQLTQQDFYNLLDEIIHDGHLKENKDRDSIITLLSVNGIIRSKFVRIGNSVYTNYQFALLYKYYFGLKSRKRKM